MGQSKRVQSRVAATGIVLGMLSILGWNGAVTLFGPPDTNPTHPAIIETALATFLGWWLAAVLAVSSFRAAARLAYTWGCAMCLLHIAVAFHLAHAWSHAAAVEHVERASGFGAGLYVNYLFAGVWLADAAWMWVSFESYLRRPRWVNWAVHGFLAFIVFNAAVVFNTGFTRAVCALFFVGLAVHALRAWWRWEKQEPGRSRVLVPLRDDPPGHSPT
jgi:hypothetical protein